jgi:hypothetical protein
MALCRWSFSDHYIFDVGKDDNEISYVEVCGFGQFNSSQILNDYNSIEEKAKENSYGFFSRLELWAYLTLWAKLSEKQIKYKDATVLINLLRMYGHVKKYVQEPFQEGPMGDMDCIRSYLNYIIDYIEFRLFPEWHACKTSNRMLELDRWRKERKHEI